MEHSGTGNKWVCGKLAKNSESGGDEGIQPFYTSPKGNLPELDNFQIRLRFDSVRCLKFFVLKSSTEVKYHLQRWGAKEFHPDWQVIEIRCDQLIRRRAEY
jgi:hypothetical protein